MENNRINEKDRAFAEAFSQFVNGKMTSASLTGQMLANDHRYLVNEKFKVVMAFIEELAVCYHKRQYDQRNEWACHLAAEIMQCLSISNLYSSERLSNLNV